MNAPASHAAGRLSPPGSGSALGPHVAAWPLSGLEEGASWPAAPAPGEGDAHTSEAGGEVG